MATKLLTALLVNAIVFSALFLLMLPVRRLLGKRISPALQLALWAVVALKLIAPFGFESSLSLLPAGPAATEAVQPYQPKAGLTGSAPYAAQQPYDAQQAAASQPARSDTMMAASPPAEAEPAGRAASAGHPIELPILLLGAWAAGALAVGGVLYAGSVNLRRRVRHARTDAPEHVQRAFDECKRMLGIRRGVGLAVQSAIGTPVVMGAARPVLVLPADAARIDEQALRHVLLHELTHVKHGDLWAMRLMNALCAAYWFVPTVWLCMRLVRADIETACDHRVLRAVGRSQRLPYIATVLQYTGRPQAGRLAVAMGLCDGRPAMEKRIAGMYRAARTNLRGRITAAFVALAMLATGALTACQPSPTEPAVVGKDGGKLEEIIKSTQGAQDTTQTPAPSGYKDSFQGADKNVTINIDAAVTEPGGDMPVVEVRPHAIPMEQVKAMADVLLRGATAYETQIGMTKADLQKKIVELKKLIADDKALLDSCGGDRKTADKVKAQYEEQVAAYEALVPSAPETIERKETDWAFHPEAYYMDPVESANDPSTQSGQAFRATGTVEGYHAFIQAGTHYFGFTLGKDLYDNGYYPKWRFADDKPMTMSREEAVAFALDALGRMGVGDMRLVSCNAEGGPQGSGAPGNLSPSEALALAASSAPQPSEPAKGQVYSYYMTFVPAYFGVPLLHTGQYVAEKDAYGPPYFYEELRVRVKDGLITTLDWDSPLEEVRVENANVAAFSLEQAADAFKKQMQRAYTLGHLASYTLEGTQYEGRAESGTITITNIQLGLMRVRIKDKPDAYRLVPAWMFKGSEQLKIKGVDAPVAGMRSEREPYAYAVINAVDGSVIDPSLGY